MFQPARWKAYLQNLQDDVKDNALNEDAGDHHEVIYHIFHSQKLWFTRDEANKHNIAAREHLQRCEALLEDCGTMVDSLEQTLANTPKPSEVLDWGSLWW